MRVSGGVVETTQVDGVRCGPDMLCVGCCRDQWMGWTLPSLVGSLSPVSGQSLAV